MGEQTVLEYNNITGIFLRILAWVQCSRFLCIHIQCRGFGVVEEAVNDVENAGSLDQHSRSSSSS